MNVFTPCLFPTENKSKSVLHVQKVLHFYVYCFSPFFLDLFFSSNKFGSQHTHQITNLYSVPIEKKCAQTHHRTSSTLQVAVHCHNNHNTKIHYPFSEIETTKRILLVTLIKKMLLLRIIITTITTAFHASGSATTTTM